MADQKITELTELTTPATSDILPIVDDPGGTPSTKKVTVANILALGSATSHNYGMARQAIINGNFDVWQRGTSGSVVQNTTLFLADRFLDYHYNGGGTLPTLTRSRQALTTGDIPNAFYFSRLATNGAGTSLGAGSIGIMEHKVEHGTRFLAGNGKKVTLSFWAKSDIANKKLGVWLRQNYGTGGSPTSAETINGTNWTLTTSWTKYTHTFTTNTLSGKTFGTANDDFLDVLFNYMWGTDYQTQNGASGAETYVGSGNIDIAQVQLCAGEVALPFQPKSFEEELRVCQRYCYVPDSTEESTIVGMGYGYAATGVDIKVFFPVSMRIKPSLTATAGDWVIVDGATALTVTSISLFGSTKNIAWINAAVASGATQFRPYSLSSSGANKLLILSAEL